MSKILIIHHLEPIWQSGYERCGTNFDELCYKFVEYLEENPFDKIILTQFEHFKAQTAHYNTGIAYYINQWEEYGYGWVEENFSPEYAIKGIDFCDGGNHSEVVLLADWMKELKEWDEVYISGAFDGECLEDLEVALDFLEIPYNRIEELIL